MIFFLLFFSPKLHNDDNFVIPVSSAHTNSAQNCYYWIKKKGSKKCGYGRSWLRNMSMKTL